MHISRSSVDSSVSLLNGQVLMTHTMVPKYLAPHGSAAIFRLVAALLFLPVAHQSLVGVESGLQQTGARSRHVVVRDDSAADPTFVKFKARLLAAARSGDTVALVDMMAPDVKVSYEASTRDSVLSLFGVSLGRPWRGLRDALELGVFRQGNMFVAPLTDGLDLDDDEAVIIRRNVRLRASPSADSAVLRVLSIWEIVILDRTRLYDAKLVESSDRPSGSTAWARVSTSDGQAGYVYGRLLLSSENTRFVFEQVDGAWKLTGLAAGGG
jgi:hypothetical protein